MCCFRKLFLPPHPTTSLSLSLSHLLLFSLLEITKREIVFKYFVYLGPLVPGQTHKQQVTVFCQQKIRRATEDSHQLVDRQSYILLWELLLLLLRQNGTIVGTDIAELLLKDHEILLEPVVQVWLMTLVANASSLLVLFYSFVISVL